MSGIVLTVALAVFFFTAVTPAVVSAADIYVGPGEAHTTIQGAATAAVAYDTIIVRDGTYYENVVVTKRLTIRSENGTSNCIVNASDSNNHVFRIDCAHYVNVSGFTIENATDKDYSVVSGKAGIYLYGSDHCNISYNPSSSL